MVDQKLNKISNSFWDYTKIRGSTISLGRTLETSLGLGCTMIMNKKLKEISLPFPRNVLAHDNWLSLVAVCFGKVKYVDIPTLLYRQHSSNVSGAEKMNIVLMLKNLLRREKMEQFRKNYYQKRNQAIDFYENYKSKLSNKQVEIIETYISLANYKPVIRVLKIIQKGISYTGGNIRDIARLLMRWPFL
ncbi:MAG: hypothetical protein ACK4F9_01920 [Brevinematia bacterium]